LQLKTVLRYGQEEWLHRGKHAATPFLAVTALAGWHDIAVCVTSAFRERRNMVLREAVFPAFPAIDTSMLVRRLQFDPLLMREVADGGLRFASAVRSPFGQA